MLKVVNIVKTYKSKKADTVYALNNVSIDFPETGLVFLLGKSGSGKSTLLNAIGGLDKFDSGEIIIKGKSSKDFTQSDFDSYRNTFIGFIFQEYNILENFTVSKNLALALELQGKKATKEEVNHLLEQVDMLSYANRKPNQLSGGQKQRVAIARALIKNPEIIMADEPTGALDSNTGKQVMDTLKQLSKTKLVIIVSHDREFAEIYGDRIIELKDGKIIADLTKKEIESRQTASGIKLIGNDMLYIKKGQQITDAEVYSLTKFIKGNVEKSDLFISFDSEGNKKLKEGARINDDGNKESFVNTTPEDIKQQQYNGGSLKLIRSHLKFSDSFKMGASSLKTKVGKLIFTILLSFIAFTVFGVVDAFSSWNRAASVYDGIKQSGQKVLMIEKELKDDYGTTSDYLTDDDITSLKQKYPNYNFRVVAKPTYTTYGNFGYLNAVGIEQNSNSMDVGKIFGYGCAVNMVNDDLQKLGWTVDGRLPVADDEIAISKHLWWCLKHNATTETRPTDFNGIEIQLDTNSSATKYKVVGVVEDNIDMTKYEMQNNNTNQNNEMSLSFYMDMEKLSNSPSTFIYLSKNAVTSMSEKSGRGVIYADSDDRVGSVYGGGISKKYTLFKDFVSNDDSRRYLCYFKGYNDYYNNLSYEEKNNATVSDYVKNLNNSSPIYLGVDEVVLSEYIFRNNMTGEIPDYIKQKIDNGQLKAKITNDIDRKDVIKEVTVVGLVNSDPFGIVGDENNSLNQILNASQYSKLMTILNGTSEDESLVKYCETYRGDERYTIQNEATSVLDNFESIILNIAQVFLYIGIAFAVFASLLLMNFISTSIAHKKREIGVLRALGARGSDVFGIFFNESCIIAFINFVLSSIATFTVCFIVNRVIVKELGMPVSLLTIGLRQFILLFAVSFVSAFIASFLPTYKISKKRPIDAINNR